MNSSAISTASAEGRARIAETHAAVASAIFVAFPCSLDDRKRLSNAKNVPIPPKTLRHATAHPATANIHEEAAIAAPEASAIPTAKRTFAVVFQTSRKHSIPKDGTGMSDRDETVIFYDLEICNQTYFPPVRKPKKNPGNIPGQWKNPPIFPQRFPILF